MSLRRAPFRRAGRSPTRAVAAVEFAITMPVLLLIFLATFDVARMLAGVEEARRAAIAAADAASCNSTLTNAALSTIMQGMVANGPSGVWSDTTNTGLIMTVFSTNSTGRVTLTTQVKYPSTLTQTSAFGCQSGSTPVIASYATWEAGDVFIVGEVFYKFQPYVFSGRLLPNQSLVTFHDYIAYRPRQPTAVGSTSSPAAGTC